MQVNQHHVFRDRADDELGSNRTLLIIFSLWLLLSILGLSFLFMHDVSGTDNPESVATSIDLARLPVDRTVGALEGNGTAEFHLLIAIHPQCPCSKKSIDSLQTLLSGTSGYLPCTALVFTPSDAPQDWLETSTMAALRELDNVNVVKDIDGNKSQEFQLVTSGTVLLLSTEGLVLYRGGITASRGCDIESTGASSVAALIAHKNATVKAAPTYGCRIIDNCPN